MTPQLLELSGIGKSSVLSQLGIEQLQGMELPVGENLQDHLMVDMKFFLTNDTQSKFDPSVHERLLTTTRPTVPHTRSKYSPTLGERNPGQLWYRNAISLEPASLSGEYHRLR